MYAPSPLTKTISGCVARFVETTPPGMKRRFRCSISADFDLDCIIRHVLSGDYRNYPVSAGSGTDQSAGIVQHPGCSPVGNRLQRTPDRLRGSRETPDQLLRIFARDLDD